MKRIAVTSRTAGMAMAIKTAARCLHSASKGQVPFAEWVLQMLAGQTVAVLMIR